jgi:hypothetical protein
MFFEQSYSRPKKRSLSAQDRERLWIRSKKKCEACKRKIPSSFECQAGHKKAFSKGGKTNKDNIVCLCYNCNRIQGTKSWEFLLEHVNIKAYKSLIKKKEKIKLQKKIEKLNKQAAPFKKKKKKGDLTKKRIKHFNDKIKDIRAKIRKL